MPSTLIHVSDLHVGAHEEGSVEPALRRLIEQVAPELVVATGDLTHRGRADQHERAAAFLQGLGPPVLAIPGNHDIPYTFPARVTRPWEQFERHWQTVEPVFASDGLRVVGLNSVQPRRHQSGALSDQALARAAGRLGAAADGAVRIACLHHHLIAAPWRSRKRPVARRGHVLGELVGAGAELILSGHVHQSAASERREFEVGLTEDESAVIVTAPGLGQPRPNRRGEARGLHVIVTDATSISIETQVFAGDDFTPVARRWFPRRA